MKIKSIGLDVHPSVGLGLDVHREEDERPLTMKRTASGNEAHGQWR